MIACFNGQFDAPAVQGFEVFYHAGVAQGVFAGRESIADNDLSSSTDIVTVHFTHNIGVAQCAPAVPGIFELRHPATLNLGTGRAIIKNQLSGLNAFRQFLVTVGHGCLLKSANSRCGLGQAFGFVL